MKSILRRYSVGKVFVPATFRSNQELLRELKASGVSSEEVLWTQQAVAEVGEYKIEIAAPQHFLGQSDNDGSMFTRISGENSSVILTGDASIDVESKMIRALRWKCDVLKGGHHGSKSSTGLRILHDSAPKFVVFSCGRNNVYGHPSPDTLDRVAKFGAKVFRTDEDGTLTFVPSSSGFMPVR